VDTVAGQATVNGHSLCNFQSILNYQHFFAPNRYMKLLCSLLVAVLLSYVWAFKKKFRIFVKVSESDQIHVILWCRRSVWISCLLVCYSKLSLCNWP